MSLEVGRVTSGDGRKEKGEEEGREGRRKEKREGRRKEKREGKVRVA